jgi:hypothetical protein
LSKTANIPRDLTVAINITLITPDKIRATSNPQGRVRGRERKRERDYIDFFESMCLIKLT